MSLSEFIGTIGSAEYLFIEGQEPTNDYDEVIEAKEVKKFIKNIKTNLCKGSLSCGDDWKCFNCWKIEKDAGDKLI